jgi:hypothetical protein
MTNANQLTNPAALCLPIMTNEGFWFLDLMNQCLQNKYLEWSGEDYYSIFLVRLYRKLIGIGNNLTVIFLKRGMIIKSYTIQYITIFFM